MAITSVVVVADDETVEGGGSTLEFTPGDPYPVGGTQQLRVRQQPFPRPGPPTRVVPSIVEVQLSYGHFQSSDGVQPAPFQADEHSFRELRFSADYVPGSWQVVGDEGLLQVRISGGLRDNTPSGDAEPDDPFIARLRVQAICIWTTEATLLDELGELTQSLSQTVKAAFQGH